MPVWHICGIYMCACVSSAQALSDVQSHSRIAAACDALCRHRGERARELSAHTYARASVIEKCFHLDAKWVPIGRVYMCIYIYGIIAGVELAKRLWVNGDFAP